MESWLQSERRSQGAEKFAIWDVVESPDLPQAPIQDIEALILGHLMSPQLLRLAADRLKGSALRDLVSARLSANPMLERGCFGEILAASILETIHGQTVPIRKLRYRTASHDASKATDVFSLTITGNQLTEIGYNEVKFRSTDSDRSTVAAKAHQQLKSDVSFPTPAIVAFVLEILVGQNSPLTNPLMDYLENRQVLNIDSHRIFLVVEQAIWDERYFESVRELDDVLQPLHIHIVAISNLVALVDETFRRLGLEPCDGDD